METKSVLEIKRELQISMNQLKQSIDAACDKMSEMYSEDHYIVKRIRSYYSALEKQQEYVNMLDILIERKDFEGIDLLSLKIKAIADMIKSDARSLLSSINTGYEDLPEDLVWN